MEKLYMLTFPRGIGEGVIKSALGAEKEEMPLRWASRR